MEGAVGVDADPEVDAFDFEEGVGFGDKEAVIGFFVVAEEAVAVGLTAVDAGKDVGGFEVGFDVLGGEGFDGHFPAVVEGDVGVGHGDLFGGRVEVDEAAVEDEDAPGAGGFGFAFGVVVRHGGVEGAGVEAAGELDAAAVVDDAVLEDADGLSGLEAGFAVVDGNGGGAGG